MRLNDGWCCHTVGKEEEWGGGGGRRRGRAEYAIPSKYYNTKMQLFEMHFAPPPPPHVNLQLGFQGSLQIPQTGREPW